MYNIFRPSKNPRAAFIFVAILSLGGIIGGFYFSKFIAFFSLAIWAIYTAILSFLQYIRKSKHKWTSVTDILLHPQIRFFVFEFLAFSGMTAVIKFGQKGLYLSFVILFAWFLFATNYYNYYSQFAKFENVKFGKGSSK